MKKVIILIFLFTLFSKVKSQSLSWINETIVPYSNPGTVPMSKSPLIALSWNQLFFIGNDYKVRNYYTDANNHWQEVPINTTAQTAMANSDLVFDQALNLYYVGSDGYIYRSTPFNGPWPTTQLNTFSTGIFLPAISWSRLAISFPASGQIKIYYTGTDTKVHYVFWNGTSWETGILNSAATNVRSYSVLKTDQFGGDVYYFGTDNKIRKQNNATHGLLAANSTNCRGYGDIVIDENQKVYYIGLDSKIRVIQAGVESILNANAPTISVSSNFTYNDGNIIYMNATTIYSIYNNGTNYGQFGSSAVPVQYSLWNTQYFSSTYGSSFYFDNSGVLHRLYPNLTISNITVGNAKLYEKFEIGVNLPLTTLAKVNSFLSSFNPLDINPYDPEKIQVKATFTDPSNNKYIRYGFYYKDVTAPGVTAYIYTITPSAYPFRVRIAPEATGQWTVSLELSVNSIMQASSSETFNVVVSGRKGPLVVDAGNTYLKYKNSGDNFFIIGQNTDLPWSWDNNNPDKIYIPSSSRKIDYQYTQNAVSDLANNKANFVRIRMVPHSFDLEGAYSYNQTLPFRTLDKCLNNYDPRQHQAWEFDRTLDLLEQNNIYSMFTLFYDPAYCYNPCGESTWQDPYIDQDCWHFNPHSTDPSFSNTLLSNFPCCPVNPVISCVDPAGANFANSIKQFFAANTSSSPIFKKVMNKMYYVMARWGYSPNIAMWQIMNEVNQVTGIVNGCNSLYGNDATFRGNVENWITNINIYLKSMYPSKLSINGYGTNPTSSSQNANLDLQSYNPYSANVWDNQGKFNANKLYRSNNKRFINSEIGYNAGVDGCMDIEAHNAVWSGMFSGGMGTPLYFWDQYEDNGTDHRSKFKWIDNFLHQQLDPNILLDVNPVPGLTVTDGASFYVGPDLVKKRIENFYMNLGNTKPYPVIGWVHNYGTNWYGLQQNNSIFWNTNCPTPTITVGTNTYITTISTYTPWNLFPISINPSSDINNYTYTEKGLYSITGKSSPSATEPRFEILGLNQNANYWVFFYCTRSNFYVGSDYGTTDSNGKLSLTIDLGNTEYGVYDPDLVYTVADANLMRVGRSKESFMHKHENINSESIIKENFLLYPNPSNGVVTIELLGKASFASVEIYNTMGQKLNKIVTNGERVIKIDISGYGENMLLLKVNTMEGESYTKRCVINN